MQQMPDEVLGQLLEDCRKPQGILGANGLLASLQKTVLERVPEAEPTDTPGLLQARSGRPRAAVTAKAPKRVLTGKGSLRLKVRCLDSLPASAGRHVWLPHSCARLPH